MSHEPTRVHPDLGLALALADEADGIALPRFRASDLQVETKADLTPVTDADRAVEDAIRTRLARERPGDAILGEELGGSSGGGRRWIVDPIDGTKNFARGIPIWGTLIALEEDGTLEVAVASSPALGRRWWAVRGAGAYASGERLGVSRVSRLEEASVSVLPARRTSDFAGSRHVRAFGDLWQHMLVAEGSLDVAVDTVMHPWTSPR